MWKSALLVCLLLASTLPLCKASLDPTQRDAIVAIGAALGVTISDPNDPCADSLAHITCESDTITMLEWGNVGATGTLPSEFSALVNLTTLDLSNNSITGTIPGFLGSLPRLQRLSLKYNDLTGTLPSGLQAWTSVILLDLSHNRLSGTIPTWLSRTQGSQLRLQQNQFTGSIPTFVNPPALLDLSGTLITGSIPNSLLSNPSIVVVHLKGVAISGSLPSNMNAPSLRTLVISGSSLSGSIPASISSSPTLEHLELPNNQLSGTIPDIFTSLVHLKSLLVNNNTKLTGSMPLTIRNTSLTHIDLSNTSINLCKTTFPGSSPFQAASVCQIDNLSTCGCSMLWATCQGAIHCVSDKCLGAQPHDEFYCTERGWTADRDVFMESETLTLYGPTFVNGTLHSLGTINFRGLDAQLTVANADLQGTAHVILAESDLKRIVKEGVHNNIVLQGVGVSSVDMETEYAASCYQARSTIVITPIGRAANGAKIYQASLTYSGFWSACAMWTIPVHGVFHALLLAAGIGLVVWTYCRPGSR